MTDKPKRPMSAYMLWLNSAREQIKADNPGLKVTEIAKKGGEIWRAMKDKSVRIFPYLSCVLYTIKYIYNLYYY
jgi:hypothetical protein